MLRIYLCTALDNVGCPPSKIKRILRWLSDEALQTYARDGEQMYAKWLHAASGDLKLISAQFRFLTCQIGLSFSYSWGMWMESLIRTTKMMMMMMQKGCEVLLHAVISLYQ